MTGIRGYSLDIYAIHSCGLDVEIASSFAEKTMYIHSKLK